MKSDFLSVFSPGFSIFIVDGKMTMSVRYQKVLFWGHILREIHTARFHCKSFLILIECVSLKITLIHWILKIVSFFIRLLNMTSSSGDAHSQ